MLKKLLNNERIDASDMYEFKMSMGYINIEHYTILMICLKPSLSKSEVK